jgi:hypothetical protein
MFRKDWHVEEGPACVLCNSQVVESRDHLFFDCSFAGACWTRINIQWDCSLQVSQRVVSARSAFAGPCFMEFITCDAWNS